MGTRPEFAVVPGVSTGAIIAPFAYLGSAYDENLKYAYTHLDSNDIFSIPHLPPADSLVDTAPLAQALEQYVTDEMIEAIAAEHRRGRQLLIGTTNLDAGRPVIWNIGRIANTGHPDATNLIRSLILASASVPGAFPPVHINVEGADGELYDEMHVDGGAATQVFLYPSGIDWGRSLEILNVKGKPAAYVIRNARLRAEYAPTDPTLVAIAQRTITSMIRTQSIGDAYRILALAKRDGFDLFMTWIPEGAVDDQPAEAFDPKYMSKLFDYGYRRVQRGDAWVDDSMIDRR